MADVLLLTAPKVENSKLKALALQSVSANYELRVQNIEIFNEAITSLKALENKKVEDFPTLRLSLFDDVSFDVQISSVKTNSLGVFCIKGFLLENQSSYVVITISKKGILTAKIFDSAKNYEYKIICDILNSTQKAIENDISKMPNLPCGIIEKK